MYAESLPVVRFEDNVDVFDSHDYMNNSLVVDIPLTEIMERATGSCDGFDLSMWQGWQEMIQRKAGDSGFGYLVNSIQTNGLRADCPVGLSGGYYISEGHHRLTAAILLGLDRVFVSAYSLSDYSSETGVSAHRSPTPETAWPIIVDVEPQCENTDTRWYDHEGDIAHGLDCFCTMCCE